MEVSSAKGLVVMEKWICWIDPQEEIAIAVEITLCLFFSRCNATHNSSQET